MPSPETIRQMRQAIAHHQAGRLAEAEKVYRQVLRHDPRDADALQLLGLLAHQAGRNDEAVELIRRAITVRPRPEFYVNLSQAYRGLGRLQDCLDACRRAVQLGPNIPEAWNNLGSVLKDLHRNDEAMAAFEKAVQLRPNYFVALNNLGNALAAQGKAGEAEAMLRKSIAAKPDYVEALSNLGHLLSRLGRLDESEQLCRRAIALRPNFSPAYTNLGTALQLQGKLEEGNEVYRQGAALDPANERLHANLLSGFNYTTRWTPQQALEAHVAWAKRFAETVPPLSSHPNDRNVNRKLRIGYVSPDFKRHSVAYFLQPILEHHDRDRFEITAYSNTEKPDEITNQLRHLCDRWREIVGVSDDAVADRIRQDHIDVLIDLAGHTTGNRLAVFGRKPAPVQMTYLGYPATTGLSAIDYRITDDICDPPGQTESFHSEKLLRVPAPFLCYRAPAEAPPVVDPPVLRNGFVTFGSFNKAAKAGPETIALWAKLLIAIPSSRLLMKSRGLGDAGSRRRLLEGFSRHGVAPDRIRLIEADMGLRDHLALYGQIDVAVDTYPYHGTTTTCEAMWMGVPVVSRIGNTHVARVGRTLLNAVGLDRLAVDGDEAYVEAGTQLISNPAQLQHDRHSLRPRLAASPLSDAPRLTRALESGFRSAFSTWTAESR